jgi:hypothetical protein
MLGFSPLCTHPLGTKESNPPPPSVGSSISGGTWSKGKWRKLKKEIEEEEEDDVLLLLSS